MPAPVVKGIILSISLIAALGLAVYENPQVQVWLEEQRRKIAELLRQIGEELDPSSRREAEAFAFGGRTPATDREAEASREAAAVATGRTLSNGAAASVRRIPISGPNDLEAAEERRRKGRDYLARRNQQMYELQQRRKVAKAAGETTPLSPTFDQLVDDDGKLRLEDNDILAEKALPSPPMTQLDPIPVPDKMIAEMRDIERSLAQPLLAESSQAGLSGWCMGSRMSNPFGDEYEVQDQEEGARTPKPPVPSKVELDKESLATITDVPGGFPSKHAPRKQEDIAVDTDGLSYEEQLAIALSLSEAETDAASATVHHRTEEQDAGLAAAIAASLKEMDAQQAAHAVDHSEDSRPQTPTQEVPPLVDLTPEPPVSVPVSPPTQTWGSFFNPPSPIRDFVMRDPLRSVPIAAAAEEDELYRITSQPTAAKSDDDELYRITPQLTRASLATHDAQSSSAASTKPYDPVHEAASSQQQPMEACFYSAHSTSTFDHEPPAAQLIEISPPPHPAPSTAHTPSPSTMDIDSFSFQTDSDSADTFASLSKPASRALSQTAQSDAGASVVDVADADDSDVDMLSEEEGDGIATPDSWTEVGSRDGESSEEERPRARV